MKLPVYLLTVPAILFSACTKGPGAKGADTVSITSIAPSSGPVGTTVVIKGAHFDTDPSGNIVKFNNTVAAVFSSSDDSLVVTAPADGTTGPVTVAVAGSVATGPVFTYTTDSVDVYATAPAMGVEYWKNGQQIFLAPTQGNTGGAFGIALIDTDVYVGGYTCFSTYPGSEAAYWKNGKKTALTSPDSAGEIRAQVLSGNDLYFGGGENSKPAYWKNGIKYSLPASNGGYARVSAMAVNGNDVYAAGYEAGPNNEQRTVYWKNGVENILSINGGVDGGASSIAANGNDVYVCSNDAGDAVYWKNGVKVILAKFPGDAGTDARAIVVAGGSVYVAGSYRENAVYWKDGNRITLPKKGFTATASAITFYQSDIYVGGEDGNSPVYWKNGIEVPLCCSEGGAVSGIVVIKKR